ILQSPGHRCPNANGEVMQMAVSEVHSHGSLDEPRSFLSDMSARHARARRHVAERSTDTSRRADRIILLKLLNEALASEIACMLRYRRHFYLVHGTTDEALMGELLDRANEEQR